MPATVRNVVGAVPPAGWGPEPCPDLVNEPWAAMSVPWRDRIAAAATDAQRTAGLGRADVNVDISLGYPTGVWLGSVAGMPYQTVDTANGPFTAVWDLSRPVTWNWFTPTFPMQRVPLPNVVRREGDPGEGWDRHWYGIDANGGWLWEAISLDNTATNVFKTWFQTSWTAGYPGSGPGIVAWNMRKEWNAAGQPRGVVAAQFPQFPHCIRYDEFVRGEIRHALFGVLPNYAPAKTGYAQGFDGSAVGHPLRAGERLRLPAARIMAYSPGTPERIVAEAMHAYGITIGDRSDHSGSAVSKPCSLMVAQDPRIAKLGWSSRGMGLRLSDFEVVAA